MSLPVSARAARRSGQPGGCRWRYAVRRRRRQTVSRQRDRFAERYPRRLCARRPPDGSARRL